MNHQRATSHPELEATVRRADEADARAIAELVNDAYLVEQVFVDGERTSEAEICQLMRDGGHFLVLYRRDGRLAASIYVRIGEDRGYFGLLSVDPSLQGLGLGRRLIAVAEALCTAEGCAVMDLQVVNLRAELPPWYRSMGYEERGTRPFPSSPPPKRACHFIVMSKPLEA